MFDSKLISYRKGVRVPDEKNDLSPYEKWNCSLTLGLMMAVKVDNNLEGQVYLASVNSVWVPTDIDKITTQWRKKATLIDHLIKNAIECYEFLIRWSINVVFFLCWAVLWYISRHWNTLLNCPLGVLSGPFKSSSLFSSLPSWCERPLS